MAGTFTGAMKSAARKSGCTVEQWVARREAGERWCYRCKRWLPIVTFCVDRSRSTGHASICKPCNNARSRRSRYQLTEDEHALLAATDTCPICRRVGAVMVIDHDHTTGAVRGAICSRCNVGLGQFQDNPDLLAAAIAYLQENTPHG